MAKIKWSRPVLTSTCGQVVAGQVSDVTDADAERYVRNGWAEHVQVSKPAKKPAGKAD